MPSVLTVIVTHGSREPLVECVRALQAQTRRPDGILIVDNASPEAAAQTIRTAGLEAKSTEFLRLEENGGPAGGFHAGLAEFLQTRFDAVWAFDDDVIPDVSCLDLMLREREKRGSGVVLFPRVIGPDGREPHLPAWHGVLIPRSVIEGAGLPDPRLVWWMEDTEYLQWRIPRAGFQTAVVHPARARHACSRRGPRKPAWKYYYETRNSVYYRVHVQRGSRLPKLVRCLAKTLGRILLREDRKLLKLALAFRGLLHGFCRRLGKTVELD